MRRHLLTLASLVAVAAVTTWSTPSAMAIGHGDKGCAKCHVPHNAHADTDVPLWNPEEHATTLDEPTYDSPTMQASEAGANASTLEGTSLLCLSCHDGTHSSPTHAFGVGKAMGSLASSHPIGITYADAYNSPDDGELVDPATLEPGVLDASGKVGCASCHDPHSSIDTTEPDKYLRWAYLDDSVRNPDGTRTGDTRSDDFCRHCHVK
ncbi:MAG: hypothetical protein GC164_02120 [Phycisphaera sp.]|nr:hypothetical protein [Phycisphaera sp.]